MRPDLSLCPILYLQFMPPNLFLDIALEKLVGRKLSMNDLIEIVDILLHRLLLIFLLV